MDSYQPSAAPHRELTTQVGQAAYYRSFLPADGLESELTHSGFDWL